MRLSHLAAVAVACCAAVGAHTAIDVLGDVVLRHDAYDDVAHASRALLIAPVLALVLAAAAAIVVLGARQARAHGTPLRGFLHAVAPRSCAHFAALVTTLAPIGVTAMGMLDAVLARRTIDDAADLLAGAPLFALAVALLAGALCGFAGAFVLRALSRAEIAIVRTIARTLHVPRALASVAGVRRLQPVPVLRVRSAPLARRRAGRAPPFSTR